MLTRIWCRLHQQDFLDAAAEMPNLQYEAGPEHSHHQQSTMQLRSDTAQNGAMQPLSDIMQGSAYSQCATLAQQAGTLSLRHGIPTPKRMLVDKMKSLSTKLFILAPTPCSFQLNPHHTLRRRIHDSILEACIRHWHIRGFCSCAATALFPHFAPAPTAPGFQGMLAQAPVRKQQRQRRRQLSRGCDGHQSFTLVLWGVSVN